ncbi:VMAP-C domain-containing protein [Streptomyces sp. O3]
MSLDGLVRPSLLRITAPGDGYDPHGDRYWGSGFFIAPGWALTCAHVVGKGGAGVWRGERAVGVAWDGGTTTGEVVLARPWADPARERRGRWEFPDIALVRVADAQDARCMWLSDRPPSVPAEVALYGWSAETGSLGLRSALGTVMAVDGDALLISGGLPVDGMSGGPVVDLRYGAVIGLSKGRGQREGAATPITALHQLYDLREGLLHSVIREHDASHLARLSDPRAAADCWPRAQVSLREPGAQGISPVRRTHLHARLAELPPPGGPGDVLPLVEATRRELWMPREGRFFVEPSPRTWREGVGLLHGLRHQRSEEAGSPRDVDAVLFYAAKVVEHTAATAAPKTLRALTEWINREAEECAHQKTREEIAKILDGALDPEGTPRAPGQEAPRGARADVLVVIGEPVYGDRHGDLYPWSVKLLRDDGRDVTPLYGDDKGVRRERLSQELRGPLADALRHGDQGVHLAAVEAVLPRELFDLPLDEWRLAPEDPAADSPGARGEFDFYDAESMPLGMRRVVVIRDGRRHARRPTPEWRRRWAGVSAGPLSAVPLRGTAPDFGHARGAGRESPHAVYTRLSRADDASVPVCCGPVGGDGGVGAMNAALAAGHPLALWRRGHDHSDCEAFHQRAEALLRQAGRADGALRHRIGELRRLGADPRPTPEIEEEAGWARGIALLFDPPSDGPAYGEEAIAPPGPG